MEHWANVFTFKMQPVACNDFHTIQFFKGVTMTAILKFHNSRITDAQLVFFCCNSPVNFVEFVFVLP